MELNKLKGKKVLILGYGKEGKVTELYLRKYHPDIKIGVADKTLSEDYLNNQMDYDYAIKTPGIPGHLLKINYTTATNIFFDRVPKKQIIGVTGSKGKSTTASLITHILKSTGKDVRLVGNIGIPALEEVMNSYSEETVFVCELSSYQLEDIKKSPHISIVVSIFPEHMDYHGTVEKYYDAKKNIIRFSNESDIYIFNDSFEILRRWSTEFPGMSLPFETDFSPKSNLIGKHNSDNIHAAVTLSRILPISDKNIGKSIQTFQPLPHRLQNIGTYHHITFYDDAISTTPQSTIAALDALGDVDTIFLGGQDRGYDFDALVQKLKMKHVSNIVLFPETGNKIGIILDRELKYHPKIMHTSKMSEAVKFAFTHTKINGICLLSTASPSYSLWKDFIEKGEQFQSCIIAYEKNN